MAALATQSCGLFPDSNGEAPAATSAGSGGAGGSSSVGGTGVSFGGTGINVGGSLGIGGSSCSADTHPLTDQRVAAVGPQRVFYSWTTDAQIAELRAGGPLFSRSERPGLGRGVLFTELANFAKVGSGSAQTLAGVLESNVFAKARFAWPNPWATLLGWPGEAYGNQLLQIELKPEAWVLHFSAQGITVYDAQQAVVPLEAALATPERIGAIYYESQAAGGPYCGSFSQGGVAFREFALGNLAMVQSWSLATPEIAARLAADIAALRAFERALACLEVRAQPSWSTDVSCGWSEGFYYSDTLSDYAMALGIPSELYWPSPRNIAALIAALEASAPTGDPLVVIPGQ